MKLLKMTFLILFSILIVVFLINCPKLKLVSSFAAKNMASCYFLAHQHPNSINKQDNGSFLISLAKTKIDEENKQVTATVFGLFKSTAIYRKGVGVTLVNDDSHINPNKPNRIQKKIELPYPHGHLPPIDTILSNVDYDKLNSVVDNCFVENYPEGTKNTRAVLVLHKGKLIAEKYANGFDKNSLFQGWSITKSLLTTSFGVLEKEGYDIHKPITAFAEWKGTEKEKITTNHLLQMESGIKWEENYKTVCDVTKMLFKDNDCTKRALNKELIATPGERFGYESGNSNILSALLRKQFKTHQEYLDFPYKNYIDKIGMHSLVMETDAVGNYICSSYSWATARDWAKFGQFFLQKGTWNKEQILSEKWTKYIATPNNNSNREYGGQWWLNQENHMPNVPQDCFYADGFEGQRIFVIPSKDLVIVRFGITRLNRIQALPLFDNIVSGICQTIK